MVREHVRHAVQRRPTLQPFVNAGCGVNAPGSGSRSSLTSIRPRTSAHASAPTIHIVERGRVHESQTSLVTFTQKVFLQSLVGSLKANQPDFTVLQVRVVDLHEPQGWVVVRLPPDDQPE